MTRRFPTITTVAALVALALAAGPRAARLIDANLVVSLAGPPTAPIAGQTATYTATVLDDGPDQATSVSLTVTASGPQVAITGASASPPGSACQVKEGARSVRCVLGALAAGGSARVSVSLAAPSPGTITVTAKARAIQYDPVAADSVAQAKTHVAELVPPVPDPIFSAEFARPFSPHRSFSLRWRATDTGSGVASYDVRYRAASATSSFGPYRLWLSGTTDHGATFTGKDGSTYCFSYRATDFDGNRSAWTPPRCVAIQLPPIELRRSSGWTKASIDGSLRTRRAGASLRLAGVVAQRIVLSALAGPSGGRIEARWNGRLLRTVDLHAPHRTRTLLTLAAFPRVSRGTLALTVVSGGKTVTIGALGIAKPA